MSDSRVLICSASHVVIRLVKKYPQCKIVNFDMVSYCSCEENVSSIVGDQPNYKFVKVSGTDE